MYDELVKRLRKHAIRADSGYKIGNSMCLDILIAADAIEELQQIADHYEGTAKDYFKDVCYYLERVPKWIPVSERLPLYGQDVLAVRTYGDGEKYQEVLMAHIAVWNEETGEKWWNATNITHWMPLPEPPKEET